MRDRLAALVPARQRRHRERRVLGQHRRERLDVAALPRIDVAVDQLAQRVVAERAQGGLLALLGNALLDRRPRALQRAVHRGDRRLERLGDLLRREAEHLAQDQHGALGGRQVLERGDEGQLHALAALVAGGRSGEAVLDAQDLVRIGLDPHRLDERLAGPDVGIGGRAVVDREHALGPPRDLIEAGVGRDRVEPRAQRAAALELRETAPGAKQRVLERVLGVVDRSQHPVAVGVQLATVGLDQTTERALVARARPLEQARVHWPSARRSRGHSSNRLDRSSRSAHRRDEFERPRAVT